MIMKRGFMFSSFKKSLTVGLAIAGLSLLTMSARADGDYHPTYDGGNFGLGLELGDPGAWGVDGKLWIDSVNAFQPAVKFNNGGPAILQLDYLWHNFDIAHMRDGNGELPFYIGFGGDLSLQTTVGVAARLPIGVSYIFNKRNVPVDIYFQIVPTLWFYNSGAVLNWYPELGGHFYL
jgi:hypothetical protein